LQLAAGQSTLMHQQMKGMFVMVTFFADRAEARPKLIGREQRIVGAFAPDGRAD